MKIFYICDFPLNKGAPAIHVLNIANSLSERNKVSIFAPRTKEPTSIKSVSDINFLPYLDFFIIRNVSYQLVLFFSLLYYILKQKPDVIYTRQSLFMFFPALLSKFFFIPYITEVNGTFEEEMKLERNSPLFIKFSKNNEKICYKIAKKIIVVTPKIKEYLIKKYDILSEKIVVLENGVDTKMFYPIKKEICIKKVGLSKKYNYICFVGNFAQWQGLEYLIKAMPIILKERGNIRLLLVGDIPEKSNLQQLSRKMELGKKVFFTGITTHDKVQFYLNSSEICVAPFILNERTSKSGISAFKLYEYASCGKPIISTDIPGITKFVEKNNCGILVKPNNQKALAAAIIKLLRNPKIAKKMGENGRRAILKGYSWKHVAERTQKIIENAIKYEKN